MPNWVFNSLVVSGDKSELDKMVAHLNTPFDKHFPEMNYDKEQEKWVNTPHTQHYSNPVFAFWNICRPSDLEKYYGEEVFKNRDFLGDDGKIDNNAFMAEFVRSMSEDEDWYHWNCRNWGTKWDVAVDDRKDYSSTSMEWTEDGEVMYRFETAWSPVEEALTKLSEMFPNLSFDYEYEEEQGWGGKAKIVAGDYALVKEWDIPSSHADHKESWFECSCEDGSNPESAYYEDCPVNTEMYEWDGDEWTEKMSDPSAMLVTTNNLQGE